MPPKKINYHNSREIQLNQQIQSILTELPRLVNDYLRSVAASTTPLTRLNYVYDLRLFLHFLTSECADFADTAPACFTADDFARVTLRDLEMYQDYLRLYIRSDPESDGLSETIVQNHEIGISRKLSALRSFYKYMYKHNQIPENITEKLTMPKIHEKPIIYLDRDEISRLMDTVQTGEGLSSRQKARHQKSRERDTAIISLLAGTGIRASELIGLDLEDIDLENNAFLVTRKGGSQAILYFNDQVKESMIEYLTERNGITPVEGHEHALFLSAQRKRISPRALEDLVKKYAVIASPLKQKLSPHKLRATYGTNLYRQTGDIYLVATALGHKNVQTTKKHYAASDEKMRKQAAMEVDWIPDVSKSN